jgi:hypothetical protein
LNSSPFSNFWTRQSRVASKRIPPSWYRKPIRIKSISPNEAMATPMTINATFPSFLKSTFSTCRIQPTTRTATGVKACWGVSSCKEVALISCAMYLDHLNERDAQVQVGQVSADQAHAECCPNGYNGTEVYSASHLDLFPFVQKGCEPGHKLGHYCGEDKMP